MLVGHWGTKGMRFVMSTQSAFVSSLLAAFSLITSAPSWLQAAEQGLSPTAELLEEQGLMFAAYVPFALRELGDVCTYEMNPRRVPRFVKALEAASRLNDEGDVIGAATEIGRGLAESIKNPNDNGILSGLMHQTLQGLLAGVDSPRPPMVAESRDQALVMLGAAIDGVPGVAARTRHRLQRTFGIVSRHQHRGPRWLRAGLCRIARTVNRATLRGEGAEMSFEAASEVLAKVAGVVQSPVDVVSLVEGYVASVERRDLDASILYFVVRERSDVRAQLEEVDADTLEKIAGVRVNPATIRVRHADYDSRVYSIESSLGRPISVKLGLDCDGQWRMSGLF